MISRRDEDEFSIVESVKAKFGQSVDPMRFGAKTTSGQINHRHFRENFEARFRAEVSHVTTEQIQHLHLECGSSLFVNDEIHVKFQRLRLWLNKIMITVSDVNGDG